VIHCRLGADRGRHATSELHDHFGSWTAGLGKYGLQVTFALMAANWAVHGSNAALLQNPWARWSMVIAVAYLALLASIFIASPVPPVPVNTGANGPICCSALGNDVAAIRRSVEVLATPGTPGESTVVAGESALRFPGWPIVVCGLLLALGGAALLWLARGSRAQAVGASLMTVGLTCSAGGFALVNELKIESLFTIKTDKLFDDVHQEIAGLGTSGPERLGFIDGFKLGDERRLETSTGKGSDVSESSIVASMVETWTAKRKDGTNAVLLVIGATDRLPISGAKRRQFDANVSLARARAERVKQALLDKCRSIAGCAMDKDQLIALVSGPLHTPSAELSSPASARDGFPEDRRVDVWAIWTRKPDAAAKR
jgi:hypothetical protein